MKKARFSLVADVHLFLIKNNKILFLLRENTGYMDGYYHVPAGHLDGGEKIVSASIREAKEEIGIAIEPEDIKFMHIMHNKSNNERVAFFFEVKKWHGDIKNMEPDKCGGLVWFPLNKLPENIVPYVEKSIEYYLKGINFSHYGWD
ncbi:MAG: NUDIX domain-containing protein [Candidatus Nealsonbacteria bacterium]|nr:NUDIX domain-containing protein [Candidatus Nealsonbacteria bacterium]